MELITKRLRLRLWRDEDLPAFAALNSDPRVMQHMPKLLDRAESDAGVNRIKENFAQHGFGLWAVELIGIADFIGFTGLSVPRFAAHFTPCVLGPRLRYRSLLRRTRLRLYPTRTQADRLVYRSRQPALSKSNGTHWNDVFTRR